MAATVCCSLPAVTAVGGGGGLRTLGRTTSRDTDSDTSSGHGQRRPHHDPASISQTVDYATGEPPRVAVEHPVEMSVEARPCTAEDIERLRTGDWRPLDLRHHQERWASQQRGEAVYLLAWRGAEVFGRVTLLLRSKYEEVRQTIQAATEMNALEARPQGEGIGTALIQAAELEAARRGPRPSASPWRCKTTAHGASTNASATPTGVTAESSTGGCSETTTVMSSSSTPTSASTSRSGSVLQPRQQFEARVGSRAVATETPHSARIGSSTSTATAR